MKWFINLFKTDKTKLKQQTLVIMINDAYTNELLYQVKWITEIIHTTNSVTFF